MKRKKFKTAAGYLRSAGDQLLWRDLPEDKEQLIAAVRAGQRDILNNLLPQIGIADRIGGAELPRDGIERLLKLGGNEQQVATLETCRRWLKNFMIPISSAMTGNTHRFGILKTRHGVRSQMGSAVANGGAPTFLTEEKAMQTFANGGSHLPIDVVDAETYRRWLKEEPGVEWRCDECSGLIECRISVFFTLVGSVGLTSLASIAPLNGGLARTMSYRLSSV